MQSFQSSEAQRAFTFDINARMVWITDRELLDGLRRYAAGNGMRPFRVADFREWEDRPFDPATAIKRFGSWRKALALIGIGSIRPRTYEPGELMENLERVWRELGRRPGVHQIKRRGMCGIRPYCRCWGSLKRACELLAEHHAGRMTREELLRVPERGRGPGKPRHRRKRISLELRWRIFKRDEFRCGACGKSPATHRGVDLEVDHIVPVSKGGGNEETNLRTLCRACNRGKKDRE